MTPPAFPFDSMDLMIDPQEVRRIVRRATTRTGKAVDDEDLAQDATLRALEAFRRVGRGGGTVEHPRAFLAKVVVDAVSDHWRARRRSRQSSSEDLSTLESKLLSETPRFEDHIDFERRAVLLHDALARLGDSRRRLIEMFYIEELSVAEIARVQHRSVPAVKMELSRTRAALAESVKSLKSAKKKSL